MESDMMGKGNYASLNAGLLARKGEAKPAASSVFGHDGLIKSKAKTAVQSDRGKRLFSVPSNPAISVEALNAGMSSIVRARSKDREGGTSAAKAFEGRTELQASEQMRDSDGVNNSSEANRLRSKTTEIPSANEKDQHAKWEDDSNGSASNPTSVNARDGNATELSGEVVAPCFGSASPRSEQTEKVEKSAHSMTELASNSKHSGQAVSEGADPKGKSIVAAELECENKQLRANFDC